MPLGSEDQQSEALHLLGTQSIAGSREYTQRLYLQEPAKSSMKAAQTPASEAEGFTEEVTKLNYASLVSRI